MITYIKKDIRTVDNGVIAHGCNCQGVMGSGVASAIRNKWPEVYEKYKSVCITYDKKKDLLGVAHFVTVKTEQNENPDTSSCIIVANLFTQEYYGRENKAYADIRAVQQSLKQAFLMADASDLPLYMPPIGCGLGGLNWTDQVGPVVEQLCEMFPNVEVFVCDI